MADNVAITAGSGTSISTDEGSGGHVQRVKLCLSADGSETHLTADNTNGLLVDVTRIQADVSIDDGGNVISVDDASGSLTVDDGSSSLTVDAPVGTPVFVRLSDGSSAISALPVTDNSGSLSIDDGGNVITVDGTVAATQSGTWNIGSVASITADVNIADGGNDISIDDGGNVITVDGTVSVTQGTAAAASGAWPMLLSNGTINATLTTVSSDNCLDVNVVQTVGPTALADKAAFTEGTTTGIPAFAVFNDTISGDPSEDQAAALRITAKRGLHVNLRNTAGTAIGDSTTPIKADVSDQGRTILSNHVAFTASQSNQTLITPSSGKKFIVKQIQIKVTGAGSLEIFDETNAAGSTLIAGTFAVGDIISYQPAGGRISSTANNKLEYDTGSGAAGDITVYAIDSD